MQGGDVESVAKKDKQSVSSFQNELHFFKLTLVGGGCSFNQKKVTFLKSKTLKLIDKKVGIYISPVRSPITKFNLSMNSPKSERQLFQSPNRSIKSIE